MKRNRVPSENTVVPKSNKGKRYKCPYCNAHGTREDLLDHIEDEHEDLIPEGYTPARVLFNSINHKEKGICICGCGRETAWNEELCRYDRLSGDPKCKERYIKQMNIGKEKKYGDWNLAADPKFQKKMLEGRRISGTYTYSDGGKVSYVGSFEKKMHEFLDKIMKFKSKDIISPGPVMEYEWNGETHNYISDIYIVPYNLIVEVKDGGDNPNTRPMEDYRDKQIAKEQRIADDGVYNYVRVTNNQFDQLLSVLAELKLMMIEDGPELSKKIVRVNESMKQIDVQHYPVLIHFQNNITLEEGICIATNNLLNTVFTGDGCKDATDMLKDCNYTVYRLSKGHKTADDLNFDSISDLYESFTGNEFYSFDQIEFDSNLVKIDSVWDKMHEDSETLYDNMKNMGINSNIKLIEQMLESVRKERVLD